MFADNDIIIEDINQEAFQDLCGEKPFSIGCRFSLKDDIYKNMSSKLQSQYELNVLQHSTNSGIMCIDKTDLGNVAEWLQIMDVVGRCHNFSTSDQYAYFHMYYKLYKSNLLHCLNEKEYGARDSTNWVHHWGGPKEGIEISSCIHSSTFTY